MIKVRLSALTDVLSARLQGKDVEINDAVIDTRKVTSGSLFIALKGEQFDGHDFAADAVKNGATALLVNRLLDLDVPQLIVEDTRIALGLLGKANRLKSQARIVALTGSSGKTSVKEMTAAILQHCGNVLYTAGNFNNDIGVPLTLLRLMPEHDFAVIELGANHIGEIAYTVELTQPESALINNLAAAHLEGFGSIEGVAKAKGEIFAGLHAGAVAIVNRDNNNEALWRPVLADKQVQYFSVVDPQADFVATEVHSDAFGSQFILKTPQGDIAINLPLPGAHNISNALAASALAISVGATLEAVKAGLASLSAVPGRLFPVRLSDKKLVLDDTYNANVGSMIAAVNVLEKQPGYRIFVVGNMGELGDDVETCHQDVGIAAKDAAIDKVLSVGSVSKFTSEAALDGEHFSTKDALIARLITLLSEHDEATVLIKGSRSSAMEEITRALQEKVTC